MKRILITLLLLPGLLLAQGEGEPKKEGEAAKPKKKTAGEIEILDPGPPIEDPAVARTEIVRFQGAFRKAKKDTATQVKLIAKLGGFDHPSVYRELSKQVKSREYLVATAAVAACARQSTSRDKACKLFAKVLSKEKRTNIICAALIGLGKFEYTDKSVHKLAVKYFETDTAERRKAATRYFGYVREKRAFRMIAEQLDEPAPKDPDDPNNPPASWWKDRWYEWNGTLPHYQWALSRIVPGETFESTTEAKEWAETEGKAHGIEW